MKAFLFLTVGLAVASSERLHYHGWFTPPEALSKVIRAMPSNEFQVETLKQLESGGRYDFWMDASKPNADADIMTSPENFESLNAFLNENNIQSNIIIDDIERLVHQERFSSEVKRQNGNGTMNWENYQTLGTINSWLDALRLVFPDLVTLEEIGKSFEGRPLRVVKISTGGNANKSIFWIDATIHAREWISTGIITYIINELTTRSHTYSDLLSGIDFYILPVVNPDGYEFTHTTNRMWRKTRSDHNSTLGCLGVDANRNFGYEYGGEGGSTDKCADTYRGPEAYSEPETAAIVKYLNSITKPTSRNAFVTLHSYGHQFLTPWAHTNAYLPVDYQELKDLSDLAVAELKSHYNTTFTTGRPDNVYSGFSYDWAKAEGGFKYAYLLELRDTGSYGFLLPPEQIIPSSIETWAAIQVVARYLLPI